jgi:hypothetical protein
MCVGAPRPTAEFSVDSFCHDGNSSSPDPQLVGELFPAPGSKPTGAFDLVAEGSGGSGSGSGGGFGSLFSGAQSASRNSAGVMLMAGAAALAAAVAL